MIQRTLLIPSLCIILLAMAGYGNAESTLPGSVDPDVAWKLGIAPPSAASPSEYSKIIAEILKTKRAQQRQGPVEPKAGEPLILSGTAAFSAAVMTNIGGRGTLFNEVSILADWDGKEDLTADRALKVDDFSSVFTDPTQMLTRSAISEHTIANGFNENIFYYGDSVGNVYVAYDNTGDGNADDSFIINLPTALNAFGSLNSDDQIVITGMAVQPVADLTSWANVNGSFSSFSGQVGEVLLVSFWDTGGGLRLSSGNILVRSGLLAFPVSDNISPASNPPGIQSPLNFPVTFGGAFGVLFSVYANIGGIAVDDDGGIYYHQADLIQFTGGNIIKITDTGSNQDRSPATSGIIVITTLNPGSGVYGTASGPSSQVNRFTNYSGTSPVYGNIVSLAAGKNSALYAAVARSYLATDPASVRHTEGLFVNPADLGPTPSMIIAFSDCSGGVANCGPDPFFDPITDGFADQVDPILPYLFQAFVLGDGPDPRSSGNAIFGSPSDTLKINMQIDYSIFSGLAVDEEGSVYAISGGSPGGVGQNPSATLGEILLFPDTHPLNHRADYIDLRDDTLPNPPNSGGNAGDGDSDRFDHIFYQAPIDQVTLTPTGISGLSRGFLLYLNRTRNNAAVFTNLPNGATQTDNSTSGPLIFEEFDASHMVAGGSDQSSPFTGDDNDGAGQSTLTGFLEGGFEFVFGADVAAVCTSPWNEFYLNDNGNITFTAGDTDGTATTAEFLSGLPKIAPAWTDLNPESRAMGNMNTFPVQAMGFAGINHFKIKWVNVPQTGQEGCGSRNSFAVSLYDDGTGVDENNNKPLSGSPVGNNSSSFNGEEGPTDLRFPAGSTTGLSPRAEGSGTIEFEYGRMDTTGAFTAQVLSGYSIGNQNPAPPELCESNLSELSRSNPLDPLGAGSLATVFELFDLGIDAFGGAPAIPEFDLRQEGFSAAACTPIGQPDLNRELVRLAGLGCTTPAVIGCADTFLLFDDFFDDVQSWTVDKGTWTETGGELFNTSSSGQVTAPLPWSPSGETECTNCTYDVMMSASAGSKVFLLPWFQNNSNRVMLIMKEDVDKWVFKQVASGSVVAKKAVGMTIDPGVFYHVELNYDGSSFHLSIDGNPVFSVPGGATPSGNVGFKAKNGTARIQQIQVY